MYVYKKCLVAKREMKYFMPQQTRMECMPNMYLHTLTREKKRSRRGLALARFLIAKGILMQQSFYGRHEDGNGRILPDRTVLTNNYVFVLKCSCTLSSIIGHLFFFVGIRHCQLELLFVSVKWREATLIWMGLKWYHFRHHVKMSSCKLFTWNSANCEKDATQTLQRWK